jgi:replicative superfamily II helicase
MVDCVSSGDDVLVFVPVTADTAEQDNKSNIIQILAQINSLVF